MKRLALLLIVTCLTPVTLFAGAVEQLESISGRKLGSVPVPMPGKPVRDGSIGSAGTIMKGLSSSGGSMKGLDALNMGLQILDLIDSLNAPSAGSTPDQAEQNRLEAERIQTLRRENAEKLRSGWDSADSLHEQRLEGVLTPPLLTGTPFFATGGAPSANAAGESLVPPPTPDPLTPPAPADGALSRVRQDLTDAIVSEVIDRGISLLPASWQAKLIYDHQKRMRDFIDETFRTLDPVRLTRTIALGSPEEMGRLADEIEEKTTASAIRLVQPGEFLQGEEPEYLVRIARGDSISAADAMAVVKGRLYAGFIEKMKTRILMGDD